MKNEKGMMKDRDLDDVYLRRMCFLISIVGIVFVLVLGELGLFDGVVAKWFCFEGLVWKCVLVRPCGVWVEDG